MFALARLLATVFQVPGPPLRQLDGVDGPKRFSEFVQGVTLVDGNIQL